MDPSQGQSRLEPWGSIPTGDGMVVNAVRTILRPQFPQKANRRRCVVHSPTTRNSARGLRIAKTMAVLGTRSLAPRSHDGASQAHRTGHLGRRSRDAWQNPTSRNLRAKTAPAMTGSRATRSIAGRSREGVLRFTSLFRWPPEHVGDWTASLRQVRVVGLGVGWHWPLHRLVSAESLRSRIFQTVPGCMNLVTRVMVRARLC